MVDVPFDFRFFERFNVPLKRYSQGSQIFDEGDAGQVMFIVLEGKVEIVNSDGKVLESVGMHDVFGEMALIDQGPRSASARAVAGTEVGVITEAKFMELVSDNPAFSLYVMRQLATRIRRMNKAQ